MEDAQRPFRLGEDRADKPDDFARTKMTELRHEHGWTYSELGRRLATTPTQVRKLESGDLNISLQWMQRLARVFEVKMSALLPPEEVEAYLDPAAAEVLEVTRGMGPEARRHVVVAAREIALLAGRMRQSEDGIVLVGNSEAGKKLADRWARWNEPQRRRATELLEMAEGLGAE